MTNDEKKACWVEAIQSQDLGGKTITKLSTLDFDDVGDCQLDKLNSVIYDCISSANDTEDMEMNFDYHIAMLRRAKEAAMNEASAW